MKKNPNILWITALILGWLFDFLFWKQSIGINFAIYTVLCLIGGIFVLSFYKLQAAPRTLWLIPMILFFVGVTFVRAEPMTLFFSVLSTLFLMSILAMTYLGGRWLQYSLADYVGSFLKLAGRIFTQPFSFNAEVIREQAETGVGTKKYNLWPILRGIVIALPIVAIFASLLASADVIFNQQLSLFIKFFRIQDLPQYIFRFVYILLGAYVLAAVFLHASKRSNDENLISENRSLVPHFLGFPETTVVQGSVVILFAAFVVIQFRYFFGGQANINLAGFTYSDYARRGFGELLIVALFSLFMILGLDVATNRENEKERYIFSVLSAAIVVLVMIMLISAYQRLLLYETAYGFSRLRTYTHVVLIWIGLMLGAVVILEFFHLQRAFAVMVLTTSLGFVASLGLMDVDGFIVQQNINRAILGKGLDVPYLVSLSNDSVRVLVDEFQTSTLPGLTRDAIGAVLFCRLHSDLTRDNKDWRSFTISSWRATTTLNGVKAQLDRYRLLQDQWPLQILTPGSVTYNCQ